MNKKYTYRKITEQELIERLKFGEVEMWLNAESKRVITKVIRDKCCIENYNNGEDGFEFTGFGENHIKRIVNRYEVREEVKEEVKSTFLSELQFLLGKYSKENDSDTPDFILASYIEKSLWCFDSTVNEREKWYGRNNGHKKPIDLIGESK